MKTFSHFIQESKEAQNSIRSLEPYRVMPPLKKRDGSPNPSAQRFLVDPKTGFGPGAQQAQLTPSKVSTPLDLRGPGEKLRDIQFRSKQLPKTEKEETEYIPTDVSGMYRQRIINPSVNKGKPTEYKIQKITVPGTKDRMPEVIDTMPTPLERRIQNFWKGSHTA